MDTDTIFQGSVLLIYLISPPDEFAGGVAISRPTIEERLGRYFVVGRVPDNPEDWTSGMTISVAFDQIAHYLEFDDENDFDKRTASSFPGIGNNSLQ
jgi:hypothetical protein